MPDIGSPTLGCGLLIVINADGTVTVQDSGQGPYDGDDDTLIGVQNNANITITKLTLTGASTLLQPPFDFEGDGLCDRTGVRPPSPPGARSARPATRVLAPRSRTSPWTCTRAT